MRSSQVVDVGLDQALIAVLGSYGLTIATILCCMTINIGHNREVDGQTNEISLPSTTSLPFPKFLVATCAELPIATRKHQWVDLVL
jgi:hypothetical protein